jgi:hypothetical protein
MLDWAIRPPRLATTTYDVISVVTPDVLVKEMM